MARRVGNGGRHDFVAGPLPVRDTLLTRWWRRRVTVHGADDGRRTPIAARAMPATLLSHQAIVLPLKMRWPRWFSGVGLCIGSMAPDLEFIGRMSDDWLFSHTVGAQLWFTVPLSMGLTWILTALVLPALLPFLRDHPRLRLHDLAALSAPASAREWGAVAWSAWVGGLSHVVLDGITHGNHSGWLVPTFPVLRTPVPHFGGAVPLHDALQFWLTLVFAVVTVLLWQRIVARGLLWQWRRRRAMQLPRQPRTVGMRMLWIVAGCAALGACTGLLQQRDQPKAAAAAIAFGAIDMAAAAVLLLAVGRARVRQEGRGA